MRNSRLMLHCGAKEINRADLAKLPIPEPMGPRHFPTPFINLVEETERAFKRIGNYDIVKEEYGVTHEAKRFFGLLSVECPESEGLLTKHGMEHVVGLRGSVDESMSNSFGCGAHTFVCDNLIFSSEIVFHRKSTKFMLNDLPELIDDSLHKLTKDMRLIEGRYDVYAKRQINNEEAHDIVCKSLDLGRINPERKGQCVVASNKISKVLEDWYSPRHEEFEPRNCMSLLNCFSEHTKSLGMYDQSKRTRNLHYLFDQFTGADDLLLIKEPVIVN